jgi:hypothetical protein
MPKTNESLLSRHLLSEAARFAMYPSKATRQQKRQGMADLMSDHWRDFGEWRRTFKPADKPSAPDLAFDTRFLDDFYSRELLRDVPSIVERTQRLAKLSLAGVPKDSFDYLREAAQSYILGLPNAATALARAAIEVRLRKAVARLFGKTISRDVEFSELLKQYGARLLSRAGLSRAHRVREKAMRCCTKVALSSLSHWRPWKKHGPSCWNSVKNRVGLTTRWSRRPPARSRGPTGSRATVVS